MDYIPRYRELDLRNYSIRLRPLKAARQDVEHRWHQRQLQRLYEVLTGEMDGEEYLPKAVAHEPPWA